MVDIAVVTGGASGIGLATTQVLAGRGTRVLVIDRDRDKLADLAALERVHTLYGDVSDNATWSKALALSEDELGGLPTKFVSNAATVVVGSTLDLSDEDWRQIFEVNLMGSVRGARALLPGMIASGGGAMVFIGSIDAFMAEQGMAAYCATKGAILQFSRVLAVDHARQGIRVNCLCPGVTDTPLFRHHLSMAENPGEVLATRTQRNPLGHLLSPKDIGRTAAFLLSDDAAGITGAMIPVDAGLSTSFEFRSGDEWGDMA